MVAGRNKSKCRCCAGEEGQREEQRREELEILAWRGSRVAGVGGRGCRGRSWLINESRLLGRRSPLGKTSLTRPFARPGQDRTSRLTGRRRRRRRKMHISMQNTEQRRNQCATEQKQILHFDGAKRQVGL